MNCIHRAPDLGNRRGVIVCAVCDSRTRESAGRLTHVGQGPRCGLDDAPWQLCDSTQMGSNKVRSSASCPPEMNID